jgi:hypothetical protein
MSSLNSGIYFVIEGIFMSLTAVFGMCGNAVAIKVIYWDKEGFI